MTRDHLQTAITEAERFLAKAKPTLVGFVWCDTPVNGYWRHEHMPDTAATKRASMDLTRALADLRRSN